jgi:hypothetical protein
MVAGPLVSVPSGFSGGVWTSKDSLVHRREEQGSELLYVIEVGTLSCTVREPAVVIDAFKSSMPRGMNLVMSDNSHEVSDWHMSGEICTSVGRGSSSNENVSMAARVCVCGVKKI